MPGFVTSQVWRANGVAIMLRSIRRYVLLATLPLVVFCVFALADMNTARIGVPGAMTPGHEAVACSACHQPAPGSLRQQVQANLYHLLGQRKHGAILGHLPVRAGVCLECHTRPDDRHPVYRFREPRFSEAVELIDARTCLTCHQEHHGRRISATPDFCAACHKPLELKADPLDVPHHVLIAEGNWTSCLTCHDFHGNHLAVPPAQMSAAHPLESIALYFDTGPDPYGARKFIAANTPSPQTGDPE